MPISVVIADDHQVVRQGLRALLGEEPDIEIVGEASNGQEAIGEVIQKQPDVLVLDLALPDVSGLLVIAQVRVGSPQTKVVVFSMHCTDIHVVEALKAGVWAYVQKGAPSEELLSGLRAAMAGRRYLSTELSQRAIETYSRETQDQMAGKHIGLSPRERQVLELVASGITNREIATQLSLSTRTVQAHRASVMRKLDLHSHIDLVRYALTNGILPPKELAR